MSPNTLKILSEMENFHERYKLPKITQEKGKSEQLSYIKNIDMNL